MYPAGETLDIKMILFNIHSKKKRKEFLFTHKCLAFLFLIIHIVINNKQTKDICANEVSTHITVCEDNYKEEEKIIDKTTKNKRKVFKEIAIQVHELKPLDSDVHLHAKMAN